MISFGSAPCDEGVIRAAAETLGCAERARPWVLAATILGSSMAFIDGRSLWPCQPFKRIWPHPSQGRSGSPTPTC